MSPKRKPAATKPTTNFEKAAPKINFEIFTEAFLSDWYSEGQAAAHGDTTASPRDAAAKAVYAATIAHKGKRGVVMVCCSDASAARQVMDYLRSIFVDQPQLASMAKAITSDTVELRGGTRILATTGPRRPKDLLTTISLNPAAPSPATTELLSDEALERTFTHLLLIAAHRHHEKPDEPIEEQTEKICKIFWPDIGPREALDGIVADREASGKRHYAERAEQWEQRYGGGDTHRGGTVSYSYRMQPTSVPAIPLKGDVPHRVIASSRQDYIVSKRFEEERAEQIGSFDKIERQLRSRTRSGWKED